MKTIELKKCKDGVFRQSTEAYTMEVEPPHAKKWNKKKLKVNSPVKELLETVNDELEEIGLDALNQLTRGFFKR